MRIYDGQSRGESGEENVLSFERFPNLKFVMTEQGATWIIPALKQLDRQ